jgi:hypothetical protein
MATIEAALVAALTAETTVSALVGSRVLPVGGGQNKVYPYVTYQRISTQGAAYLDGPSNLDWPRFQIDVWGTTALSALTAAEAIRTFLDSIERSGAGLSFIATFQDQRGPDVDEETRNSRVSQDYFFWHSRGV